MQTVVVPLTDPWQDPDRVAECALPFARELAARGHARVVLVNVIEVPTELGPLSGALGVVFSKGLEKWASDCREYLEAVARTFEGGDVRTVVLHGEVGSQLLMLLDEVPDPVVVMASHCRRGPRRLLFGSVAFQLVHAARCPVMVVPPEFRRLHDPAPIGLHRVLVPLDGTVSGDETLRVLGDVLGDGLRIQLLRVLESSDAAWYYTEVERQALRRRAEDSLAETAQRLRDAGDDASPAVVEGKTDEEIVRVADDFGAELLAMPTHGRAGLSRLMLGSVAERLANMGHRPLLLIPVNYAGRLGGALQGPAGAPG
ncbi:MAG TPA: universal stress protein [Thermomicrobiales bacterium]|nr:universal stress protein [Thermomicrobiales bacterium]